MPGCQHTQVHALQRVSARLPLMALLVVLEASRAMAQAGLDPARQLYNQGHYAQAIEAAGRLRVPPTVDAANLLIARSYLEQFRKTTDQATLVAARRVLVEVRPAGLTDRDRIDYLVGLGEALYLDDNFGPAATLFESVLGRDQELGPETFDRVFDWWATSLDRQAQSGAIDDRDEVYQEIRDRAVAALNRVPESAAAAYWLAASYRYLGDLTHAWDAAVAAWVRAPLSEGQGRALRADLDQLILQAILPERVRLMASGDADRERVTAALRASWDEVKKDWPTR
jgi:tetratricopeptide (TPR) repeat protein